MKILLVDDEILNLQLLEDMLSPMNHNLLKAMDGQMALSLLKENPDTDMVLLDILMPDMNGYELCAIVKADKTLKDIPVILITALSDEASQVKGLKYGAADYITKPYKIEILEAKVNNHLLLKKQRDALIKLSEEKDALISELAEAIAQIKTLSGILPICTECKKIRDDKGYWEQIDNYIKKCSDTQFSYSLCPDCTKKLYPDLDSNKP